MLQKSDKAKIYKKRLFGQKNSDFSVKIPPKTSSQPGGQRAESETTMLLMTRLGFSGTLGRRRCLPNFPPRFHLLLLGRLKNPSWRQDDAINARKRGLSMLTLTLPGVERSVGDVGTF